MRFAYPQILALVAPTSILRQTSLQSAAAHDHGQPWLAQRSQFTQPE